MGKIILYSFLVKIVAKADLAFYYGCDVVDVKQRQRL